MQRLLFLLGSIGCSALLVVACGDDGNSELANGGRGTGAEAGEASGGSSGKGGASTGDTSTGGKAGSGGAATTGGQTNGGSSGAAPTGGGGNGGEPSGGGPSGGSPGGGEGGTSVVGNPPVATINHPGDGEMRDVNSSIPFVGVGTDAEDGMLTGGSLVWTSDREGSIGTGQNFNAALSETGMQVITLTVTDSDGNRATDSITLDMR